MEISDPIVMTVAGGIVTALTGTITKLYLDNNSLRSENDLIRNKYQEKYEILMEKVIILTTNCANQLESFNKTITTMTATLATWREDFLKGKKD